jgi:hypothetical protein
LLIDRIGEHSKIRRAAGYVDVRGNGARLAGIMDFGIQKIVEAPVDLLSHRVQHVSTLRHRHPTPRPLKRRARRTHRGIDLPRAALRNSPHQATIYGRPLFELALRSGRHELIIDEMKKHRVAHGRQPYGAKHRPSNEKWLYVQSIIGIGRVPTLIEPIHLVVRRRM